MARSTVVCWLVLFVVASAPAMFEDNESGVRPEGMAGAFTAVADDASAADYNPAGLFQIGRVQFVGFGKLLYGGVGAGLHTAHLVTAVPIRSVGTVALRLQETGFHLQSQLSVKFAHGFRLGDGLAFGYGLNGYRLNQRELGSGHAFGVDAGMFGRIYRVWTIGFYAHNLNMPRIGSSDLPRVLVVGLGFAPQPGIQSAVDVSKEPGKPTRVSVGQELRIVQDYLTLRAGVQTEPVRLAFGLRTGIERVHVDYALQTHPVLPMTHNLGLTAEF
ncbi:MAG: hypothetical protein ABIK86_06715 [candidate division WOR-3 bacterium]